MNQRTSREIKEMASNLLKELFDKKMVKKLGTSIEQHMSRDYVQKIESKFVELKNEFNSMDYNEDSYLSIDELYRFFATRDSNIRREEIEYLFELSDKDKNNRISLNEFVYIYILLEEKLKMKKESLIGVKDSLTSKVETYQKKIKEYENEQFNLNGISNESEVNVHIIELLNLKSSIMSPKYKVVLNLVNKKGDIINEKETQLINGSPNPKFNEKFSFKIEDINCYIKCTICDSDILINEGSCGFFIIEFNNLSDQVTHEMMFDIIGGNPGSKAHVSLCFIYNYLKKYKDLLSKASKQIDKVSQNIFQIENLLEKINRPYGLIFCNKINEIVDKKILNQSESVSDYLGNSRISVFDKPRNTFSYSESPYKNIHSEKDEDITRAKLGVSGLGMIPEEADGNINSNALRDEVVNTEGFLPDNSPLNQYFPKNSSFLGKKSNQLIIMGIITSIICLIFGKIDVINLILFCFGFAMIYNMFRINGRFNTKRIFFYALILAIILDVIWILVLNKDENNPSSVLRVIVFGFTIFSLIIKLMLCYLIKNRRR